MAFIDDINPATPAGSDNISNGDNEIRQLKTDVKGSFPGLGSQAVTVTAADLNDVTNKLTSFNGRTAVAAVPTSGDYELGDANSKGLGDVEITSPTDGQVLVYDGDDSLWKNAGGAQSGFARYDGLAGNEGNQPYFTTATFDTITGGGLGTLKNDATSAVGWRYTATVPQLVSLTLVRGVDNAGGSYDVRAAIAINRASTSTPTSGDAETVAYNRVDQDGSASIGNVMATAHIVLAANDYVSVYTQIDEGTGRWINLSLNVLRVG